MRITAIALALALVCCLGVASAQSVMSLPTTLAGGNGQNGNMFDLVNTSANTINIYGFEGRWAGTADFEIYAITGGGSYVGNEATPGAWTLVGSVSGAQGCAPDAAFIPMIVGIDIPAGATQGFYVTRTDGGIVDYTNGTTAGAVFASDSNLQFLEGTGNAYPFGATFTPRVFNGSILYSVGAGLGIPSWKFNSASASLEVNCVTSSPGSGGLLNLQVDVDPTGALLNPASANLTFSTQVTGALQDLLMNNSPIIPLGGGAIEVPVPGGEIVNLDVLGGGWTSVNSGAPLAVDLQPFPGVNLPGVVGGSYNVTMNFDQTMAPLTLSMQGVVTDPAAQFGFVLSSAVQIDVSLSTVFPPYSVCPSTVGGDLTPLGDDSFINVVLAAPFTFYGVTYNDVNVNMNGNLTFTNGDTDFSATEAEMLSQEPRIAPAWDDWSPNQQGTVRVSDDGMIFACEWFDVPHFGLGGNSGETNTFCVELDYANGFITMSFGQMASTGPYDTVVGISPGGMPIGTPISLPNDVDLWDDVNMLPNSNGPTAGATDAIYQAFGASGTTGVAFDLVGPPAGPGISLLFASTGGVGVGPYLQN